MPDRAAPRQTFAVVGLAVMNRPWWN